jgi:flagellar biosynthesis/type III secretory pathway protein FliH
MQIPHVVQNEVKADATYTTIKAKVPHWRMQVEARVWTIKERRSIRKAQALLALTRENLSAVEKGSEKFKEYARKAREAVTQSGRETGGQQTADEIREMAEMMDKWSDMRPSRRRLEKVKMELASRMRRNEDAWELSDQREMLEGENRVLAREMVGSMFVRSWRRRSLRR